MWTVTLYFAPEFVAETSVASLGQPCEFYRIGETILALTNIKDDDGLGEIARIEILPA